MTQRVQYPFNIYVPNLLNICVDNNECAEISGRMYHCYEKEPVQFNNIIELIQAAENLFDRIAFPQASTKTRSFKETETAGRIVRPEKVVMQQDVIRYRGTIGSFVTCVKFRQNSTWQGELFWMEKGIKRQFAKGVNRWIRN